MMLVNERMLKLQKMLKVLEEDYINNDCDDDYADEMDKTLDNIETYLNKIENEMKGYDLLEGKSLPFYFKKKLEKLIPSFNN